MNMGKGTTSPLINPTLQPQQQLTESKRQSQAVRDDVNHTETTASGSPGPGFLCQNTLGAGEAGAGSAQMW